MSKTIAYYHLIKRQATILGVPADLYETELRQATEEEVEKLGEAFVAGILKKGERAAALLRGPTNWGVARTILNAVEKKYKFIAVWYPQLGEWQLSERGEEKWGRLPATAVAVIETVEPGPAQQLAADEAAGEMMSDTSDPQT
jgi:hypothetical protein